MIDRQQLFYILHYAERPSYESIVISTVVLVAPAMEAVNTGAKSAAAAAYFIVSLIPLSFCYSTPFTALL